MEPAEAGSVSRTGDKPGSKTFFTPGKILALLVFFAIALRLLAALARPMIQFDEATYARMAENIVNGLGPLDMMGESRVFFSPLLPYFIAGLSYLLGDYIISGYIVDSVFGGLLLVPVYLLGRELISARVGLMAAALAAVTPLLVDYTSRLYSESLYVFFLMLSIYFGWMMLNHYRALHGVLAGASLGMAYMANPSAVFLPVVFAILTLAVAIRRDAWKPLGKAFAIFVLVFAVFSGPYVLFLHSELGRWTYSGKDVAVNNFTSSHNLQYGTIEWDKEALALTDDFKETKIAEVQGGSDAVGSFLDPVKKLKVFLNLSKTFYYEVLPKVIPLWLLPLLGLGLFAIGWDRKRATRVGYLVLMMSPALLILTIYAHPRFFAAYLPPVLILVAIGWERLDDWGRDTAALSLGEASRERWRRLSPWLLGIAVLLPLLAFSAVTVVGQGYATGYRDAGKWLKENGGQGSRVMSRQDSGAYYAGGTEVVLPYADYGPTTAYSRLNGVDYLIISRQDIKDWRPGLAPLAGEASSHPEWRLVQTIGAGTSNETYVFRLSGEGEG
ncbi:MAG: glycosyltransferase family 39 protein [Actinobacteria bacterium]|nr:glycosyltransferase family 39 protein [Actinomycetota bacterium]